MMANQVQRWLSKKKNRKMLFFLLGVVCLFFYVRNKSAAAPGYGDLPAAGTGATSGNGSTRVIPYPTGNGAITPKLAEFAYFQHIDLEWSGEPGNWSIRDRSTILAPAGYRLRYYAAGEEIITDTPLNGYKWECNNMFHVSKCLIKNGVTDLYFWSRNVGDPERLPDDGYMMPGNTSVAYQTWILNRD